MPFRYTTGKLFDQKYRKILLTSLRRDNQRVFFDLNLLNSILVGMCAAALATIPISQSLDSILQPNFSLVSDGLDMV